MKTKNKTLAMLEIAIVLCSVFLVALPVIATDKTTQKVSTSEVTIASEDDFVLGIYGNANEDDTIDMRDVTYTKLVIFGKKPETELADAYYDDEVDVLDVVQIKLIILGRESELTVVDSTDQIVTVNIPVERIVAAGGSYGPEAVLALGAKDKLVGVADYAKKRADLELLLEDVPGVGRSSSPDAETILSLNPDLVQGYALYDLSDLREVLEDAGIPLVQFDFHRPEKYIEEIIPMGIILDKEERAEELINFEQKYLGIIEERVDDLEEEQKPQVYMECYHDYEAIGLGTSDHDVLIFCGGINIFDDIEGTVEVDPEEVIDRNPQVIIKQVNKWTLPEMGYGEGTIGPIEEFRDAILSRPAWDSTDAVTDGRVYLLTTDAKSTHASIYYLYIAKWLHPELFEDIYPVEIHSEWLETFLGIEFKGVYGYPLL